MAQALPHVDSGRQLALNQRWMAALRAQPATRTVPQGAPLCAGCRQKEARYGFRRDEEPGAGRPRTLCFSCFRAELDRRQAVAARLARGWNAEQVRLPLDETLHALARRRRRAQIAARHALDL